MHVCVHVYLAVGESLTPFVFEITLRCYFCSSSCVLFFECDNFNFLGGGLYFEKKNQLILY